MLGRAFRAWRERMRPGLSAGTDWPDDGSWMAVARPCREFRLDAGAMVTSHVPSWLLPADAPDDSLIALPLTSGHVLTADAVGHEAELVRHFAQLPPMPVPACRRGGARRSRGTAWR